MKWVELFSKGKPLGRSYLKEKRSRQEEIRKGKISPKVKGRGNGGKWGTTK